MLSWYQTHTHLIVLSILFHSFEQLFVDWIPDYDIWSILAQLFYFPQPNWDPLQGGYGTGKTGNLVLTFSRHGKHREFCCNTGKFFETQGKYIWLHLLLQEAYFPSHIFNFFLPCFAWHTFYFQMIVFYTISTSIFLPYFLSMSHWLQVSTKRFFGSLNNKLKQCNLEYDHPRIF